MRLNKEDRPQSINEFLALLDGEEKKDDREEEATDIIGEEKTVKEDKKEEQRRETPKEKQTENRKNHPWIYVLIAAMIGFFVIYFINEKIQENKREEAEMIERHEKERQELEAQKAEQARLGRERKERETAEQQAFYKRTHGSKNGHEWVDLGLPSGKKWATYNVGAYSPEENGYYYAWGETETKSTYTSDNSLTFGLTISQLQSQGYIDGSGNLTPSHDAATANWGSSWRMPTKAELEELKNKCTWTWTTQNGVKGYKVTGPNGNSIFFPAAGYRYGSSLRSTVGNGSYWGSAPYESDSGYACYLYFRSGDRNVYWFSRDYGLSVRPVSE